MTTGPKEWVSGVLLLAVGVAMLTVLILNPELRTTWAWGVAVGVSTVGLALAFPVRARWLIGQARDALPVLSDTEEG